MLVGEREGEEGGRRRRNTRTHAKAARERERERAEIRSHVRASPGVHATIQKERRRENKKRKENQRLTIVELCTTRCISDRFSETLFCRFAWSAFVRASLFSFFLFFIRFDTTPESVLLSHQQGRRRRREREKKKRLHLFFLFVFCLLLFFFFLLPQFRLSVFDLHLHFFVVLFYFCTFFAVTKSTRGREEREIVAWSQRAALLSVDLLFFFFAFYVSSFVIWTARE